MKLENLQRIETGFYKTPIHRLDNLSKKYGINMYIKRDDLTGYALGGNKLRKLDYLLKDALDKNCTVLLTYGGSQTNHGRLTAAVAARFGLKSYRKFDSRQNDGRRFVFYGRYGFFR